MRWRDVPLFGMLGICALLLLGTVFQVLNGYFPVEGFVFGFSVHVAILIVMAADGL